MSDEKQDRYGVELHDNGEQTILRGIACGGTGGEMVAVDSKDDKIVRIRPYKINHRYSDEQIRKAFWKVTVNGKVMEPDMKTAPDYFALAYKNRVYSKNRVLRPLKRVDWEPGGDPEKMHTENRGKSKFVEISWDEALDIMVSEIKRCTEKYGPYTVLCIGEDGHRESKDLHSGGGMHATLMSKLGGYTRETRTPDSVEGWYWGAKWVWGAGANKGLGMVAPVETGYNAWNVTQDVTEYAQLLVFDAGDWELTQNYASQWFSKILKYWEALGKEMVIVDPFCNYTAVCHEKMKWIPILPNTDAALDFAVMYQWITEGTYDQDYVATHTVGFDKLKAYVLGEEDGIPKTPAWASEKCGVPEWTIKAYARNCARKTTSYVHYSSGAIKGPYSHEPGRTEAYKFAMQGLGKPGIQQLYMNASDIGKQTTARTPTYPQIMLNQCRMFYPNAQTLPRTMIADAIRDGAAKWWGSPCIVYVENSEQFKEFNYPAPSDQGGSECHILWSEKPCNQACWDGGFSFQDAIRSPKVEMYVTNHQWLENDSLFADLVLPVTTCLEEFDTVGGSSIVPLKFAGLQEPACPPQGESKSDFQIACMIAERFGIRDQIDMGMSNAEWVKFGFDQSPVSQEISWEEFKEKGYYFPPQDPEANDPDKYPRGMRHFYEDPDKYPLDTPTGKLEFYSEALAEHFPDDKERGPLAHWVVGGPASEGWTHDESLEGERCKKYPLLMCSTAPKWRVHVQGDDIKWFREIETCKIRWKDGYQYEPVWISPEDAADRGIAQGDLVKVFNDRGTILGCARVSERVEPGSITMAKCARVDPITDHLDRGGTTNLISPTTHVSKHCKGFVVTGYLIEVAKVTDEEYESWKHDYPACFERDYDPAIGLNRKSWVITE